MLAIGLMLWVKILYVVLGSKLAIALHITQMNKRFGEDWARLTKDLLFDSEGSLKFKPELWNDIRKVILPEIIDQVRYSG
jgi:hypothetical protein